MAAQRPGPRRRAAAACRPARKDGLTTYRYHPVGKTPINLGTDKDAARCTPGAGPEQRSADRGNVFGLWRLYQASGWQRLAVNTQADYVQCAKALLKVFGPLSPACAAVALRPVFAWSVPAPPSGQTAKKWR